MEESTDDIELDITDEEAKAERRAYWHSLTPQERLQALELMRQKAYGYDPATARLQRIFEVVQLKKD